MVEFCVCLGFLSTFYSLCLHGRGEGLTGWSHCEDAVLISIMRDSQPSHHMHLLLHSSMMPALISAGVLNAFDYTWISRSQRPWRSETPDIAQPLLHRARCSEVRIKALHPCGSRRTLMNGIPVHDTRAGHVTFETCGNACCITAWRGVIVCDG